VTEWGRRSNDDNSDVWETSCKCIETFQFFVYHDRASLAGAALTRAYRERVSAISVDFLVFFVLFCFKFGTARSGNRGSHCTEATFRRYSSFSLLEKKDAEEAQLTRERLFPPLGSFAFV
jgi:hypothetical protein